MTQSARVFGVRGALVIATVILIATLLMLALAEATVRVRQWVRHGTAMGYESIYHVDQRTGLRVLRAGAKTGKITINSHGFRGPEAVNPKPAGRVRIAFVGASTTFCAEVSNDAAVWTEGVVAQLRRSFPGVEFDYVNAGVPGYSVKASLDHYRHYVKRLQPDAVMIYHAANDMSGELRALASRKGIWTPETDLQNWGARYSLLWELVEKNLRVRAAGQLIETGIARLEFDSASIGREFAIDLHGLIDEAASSSHVSIATFSTRIRREQSAEERKEGAVSALVYMPFMSLDGLLNAYERYNNVIRDVARNSGALLIGDENEIPGDVGHFVDTVHFTDKGSAAMAQRVADALARDPKFRALVSAHSKRP